MIWLEFLKSRQSRRATSFAELRASFLRFFLARIDTDADGRGSQMLLTEWNDFAIPASVAEEAIVCQCRFSSKQMRN